VEYEELFGKRRLEEGGTPSSRESVGLQASRGDKVLRVDYGGGATIYKKNKEKGGKRASPRESSSLFRESSDCLKQISPTLPSMGVQRLQYIEKKGTLEK